MTDRTQLEDQLSETSQSIGFTVKMADSIEKTKEAYEKLVEEVGAKQAEYYAKPLIEKARAKLHDPKETERLKKQIAHKEEEIRKEKVQQEDQKASKERQIKREIEKGNLFYKPDSTIEELQKANLESMVCLQTYPKRIKS